MGFRARRREVGSLTSDVTIVTTNGVVTLHNVPKHTAEALVRDFATGESRIIILSRDDGPDMHIARRYIVRIDVD